jgi:hypothetical protein
MGLFGGDDEPSRGEQLLDEQIHQSQAELESKRQSLYQEKLGIIKGQGGQVWEPTKTGASAKGGTGGGMPDMGGFPFGRR